MQTADDFSLALTALRRRAGLTVREVSRRTGIPSGTLGGYFSGRHLPSLTQPRVLADLLSVLGVGDEEFPTWRDQLARVRRRPGPRPRVSPDQPAEPGADESPGA
ncbi:helix-turn-helix domain-containing protein [Nocardioides cavernaquae]|uniref:helix-turn-helix domain-containing protein n=1 Tax=Nocardioides cavernaquae TaxID=2321396 RepID=UPI0016019326|nr:helix-turn-helix transcriptional regulator [Nocardioides cavernaquae]